MIYIVVGILLILFVFYRLFASLLGNITVSDLYAIGQGVAIGLFYVGLPLLGLALILTGLRS